MNARSIATTISRKLGRRGFAGGRALTTLALGLALSGCYAQREASLAPTMPPD
jgi:hypothetical protein